MWSAVAVILSALVTIGAVVLGYLFTVGRWSRTTGESSRHQEERVSGDASLSSDPVLDKTDEVRWPIDDGDHKLLSKTDDEKCTSVPKDKEEMERTDPVEFCGHIQREIKRTKQRVALDQIQSKMSHDQLMEERAAQRQQLEDIYQLMESQKDKFGLKSVDDIEEQMKLYIQ